MMTTEHKRIKEKPFTVKKTGSEDNWKSFQHNTSSANHQMSCIIVPYTARCRKYKHCYINHPKCQQICKWKCWILL